MTIVTQFLNHHDDVRIFDEIDLIQVGRHGDSVMGTLAAFLLERGIYDDYRGRAAETGDPAAALRETMREIASPCTGWQRNFVHALKSPGVDVVLDIGANSGQYASSLREADFDGRIVGADD